METFKELRVHGIKGTAYPWLDVRQINKVLRTDDLQVASALKALKVQGILDERVTSVVGPNGRVKTAYYRPVPTAKEAPAAS
jgi:peroxiredoxin